jgi:AcrR family transcriptional regulator
VSANANNLSKRQINALETRENILDVAYAEFAEKGLAGARIDEIADKTATSKRMIYYHFGSKEGLYRAVLERAYDRIRTQEQAARFEDLPPIRRCARSSGTISTITSNIPNSSAW